MSYEVADFSFTASEYPKIIGKKFQVIFINYEQGYIPFVSKADGDGIRKNAVYVRNGTSSEEASYEDIQSLINNRLATGYSSTSELKLEQHLAQLKILYSNIDRYNYSGEVFKGISLALADFANKIKEQVTTLNPVYPEEDFECFIARMIELKKKRIEVVLDLR